MTVLPNWRAILRDAWSARLLYVVMVVEGLEMAVSLCVDDIPGPLWLRALFVFLLAALAVYARVVWQPRLTQDQDQ